MAVDEQKASILLRIDASLKDKLFAQAKRNDRTARAEASRILREGLGQGLPDTGMGHEKA